MTLVLIERNGTHASAMVVIWDCENFICATRAGAMRGKLYTPPAHNLGRMRHDQTMHAFIEAVHSVRIAGNSCADQHGAGQRPRGRA